MIFLKLCSALKMRLIEGIFKKKKSQDYICLVYNHCKHNHCYFALHE